MMQSLMGQQCRQQLLEFETNRLIVSFGMTVVRYVGNTTKPIQLDQKPFGGSDTLNFCLCYAKKLADFSCFCHRCGASTFPVVEATIIYPGPTYDAGCNRNDNWRGNPVNQRQVQPVIDDRVKGVNLVVTDFPSERSASAPIGQNGVIEQGSDHFHQMITRCRPASRAS